MYNRYIPQPDGSFRHSRMQEPPKPGPAPQRSTGSSPRQAPARTDRPTQENARQQNQPSAAHTSNFNQRQPPRQTLHGRQSARQRVAPSRGNQRPQWESCPPSPQGHCPPMEVCAKPAGRQGTGILGFLKDLLPKDFDTGDLLIILLILLMAGDCPEDQNTALLTLALYVFL